MNLSCRSGPLHSKRQPPDPGILLDGEDVEAEALGSVNDGEACLQLMTPADIPGSSLRGRLYLKAAVSQSDVPDDWLPRPG